VVFQAERHTDQSSYCLTLGKFFKTVTTCESICGDVIRTAGELCDGGGLCAGGTRDGMECSTAQAGACPGGSCHTLNDGNFEGCSMQCKAEQVLL
jgi:hypothetical protein